MQVAVFDSHPFERSLLNQAANRVGYSLSFFETTLHAGTASLAKGYTVVCSFTNDRLDADCIKLLASVGVKLIALRSAGFNHVDISEAVRQGIPVVRVPSYSPFAIAEHATCLILSLNRKICRANARVHDLNFSLDGLVGFDMNAKKVGVIGTGKIGAKFCKIMAGFGCKILAYDRTKNPEVEKLPELEYVPLTRLFQESDVISLHVPLNSETRHLIDSAAIQTMKKGVMLINTGRGALIETSALIQGLKNGHVGFAGLDVYEEEENIFFHDLSGTILQDDRLARLLSFPNVLMTSHQAFLTDEALRNIADTTLESIRAFDRGEPLQNAVKPG